MDGHEKQTVQQNFRYLVRECKADELLDYLFSKEAIDLDDYQRVFKGYVAESDKMRELLGILLRKSRIQHGDVFKALLDALKNNKRDDVAEVLMNCYKCTKSSFLKRQQTGNSKATYIHIPSRNNGGFCFTSGTARSVPGHDEEGCNVEGMDIADGFSNNTTNNNQTQTTKDLIKDDSSNIPVITSDETKDNPPNQSVITFDPTKDNPPNQSVITSDEMKDNPPNQSVITFDPTKDNPPNLPVITAEQVKKAVSLNPQPGSSGKLSVGGRSFSYVTSGQYNNGELKWNMKVTEEAMGLTVERLSGDGQKELLESCILTFI